MATKDETLHCAFLMHEAWDAGIAFIASTAEQAYKKATNHCEAQFRECWNGPGMGEGDTIEEWIEMCWEQDGYEITQAEVWS